MAGIAPARRAVPGAGMPGWSPFATPTSAPFLFDAFDDGVIAPTEFDPGGILTTTEELGDRLRLDIAGPGGNVIGARVWPMPAVPAFNFTAGVSLRAPCVDNAAAGIVFGGSDMLSSPAVARLIALYNILFLTNGPGSRVELSTYTRYDNFDTMQKRLVGPAYPFIRMAFSNVSLGRLAGLVSRDCIEWFQFGSINQGQANLGGASEAPAFGGVYLLNGNTGQDISATFPMVRVDITADMYAPVGEWFDE